MHKYDTQYKPFNSHWLSSLQSLPTLAPIAPSNIDKHRNLFATIDFIFKLLNFLSNFSSSKLHRIHCRDFEKTKILTPAGTNRFLRNLFERSVRFLQRAKK